MTDRIDREPRGHRSRERRNAHADAEYAVVPRTLVTFAERADEMLNRDRIEDVARADQRRGNEQGRKPRQKEREREADHQTRRPEQHRAPETEPVGELPRIHREKYGKHRIHGEEHAHRHRRGAEVERIQGNQYFAALEARVGEHGEQHDEVDGHLSFYVTVDVA